MRIRWPHSIVEAQLSDYSGKCEEPLPAVNPQTEIKLNDSRCDSPVSCCVSHRSSVSMDSGCVSLSSDFSSQSSMLHSTYRKLSLEEQRKKCEQNVLSSDTAVIDENPRIVATAIESTTALRCHEPKCYGKNWPRPKSMCSDYPDENTALVDSFSFSQITPPPVHRKFTTIGRSESVQTHRPYPATSCVDVRSMSPSRKEQSPIRFAVNQSPILHAKPVTISSSTKMPTSPYMRLRNPQKPLQSQRITHLDSQTIFHASRVFVDRSPRNVQRPKQFLSIERFDSDEDSPRPLRAQPAIVLSRQQSYVHSSEGSPAESRKVQLIESPNSLSSLTLGHHQQLNRCESSLSSETIVTAERPRRRMKEKDWKESEGL